MGDKMIEEAPERDSSFVVSEYNDGGNYKDESFSDRVLSAYKRRPALLSVTEAK